MGRMVGDEGDGLTVRERGRVLLPFAAVSFLVLSADVAILWGLHDGKLPRAWFWATGALSCGAQVPMWVGGLVLWRIKRRRRERLRSGSCLRCGYPLTGNTSGACPEYGTPTPQPPR